MNDDTLTLWMRLRDEVTLGRDNPALYDTVRDVSDDIHEGNLPWDHPELFVDTIWSLGKIELALGAQLLFDIVAIKNDSEKRGLPKELMRTVQDFNDWINFHKAIDEAFRVVDDALREHSRT